MGTNKKEKRMRVLETCAVWAVTEVPALMTPFTENIMWHFAGAGAHSSTLGCRPPRNPYANPPSEAQYYGKIDAPLAGVMDKTTTLDAQLDTITQDWAAKRGGKGAEGDRVCRHGSWLLLRATLFWLLSAGGCALVAVQHYHLYKDAAMRHCAFEAL